MRTVCSICLDEVGKEQLVAAVNCGHVFDVECIRECLKTNSKCPVCRKGIQNTNMQSSQWCRIFLSTESDSNSKEFKKLKDDLAQDAIIIDELQKKLTHSEGQVNSAERISENLLKTCDEDKAKLDAAAQELKDAKSAYHAEVQKTSIYVEQIMDLTLAQRNHANEVDDWKKKHATMARELQSQRDKCTAMAKKISYEKEYFDLKESFDDVLAKQGIMNTKYIELAISGTTNPEAVRARIQNLEKQLTDSKAKEDKLFADIKRLAKKKSDIYDDRHKIFIEKCKLENDKKRLTRENYQLREKLGYTNEDVATEWGETTSNHSGQDRDPHKQLKTAKEHISKLQEYKQNWIAENCMLQQDLKKCKEKVETLQGYLKVITSEKNALQKRINEGSSTASSSTTGRFAALGNDSILLR